jgi:hypothetical protein
MGVARGCRKQTWKVTLFLGHIFLSTYLPNFLLHIWAFCSKGISETPLKQITKQFSKQKKTGFFFCICLI